MGSRTFALLFVLAALIGVVVLFFKISPVLGWTSVALLVVAIVLRLFGFSLRPYRGTLSALPDQDQEKKRREWDWSAATYLGYDDSNDTIGVDDVARQGGCYVLGVQGVGKSSLLEQMIYQDICKGYAVIVLDPHGDLIDHALAQMPDNRLKDVSLLSIEDTAFPFGLNLFSIPEGARGIEQSQALNRVTHVFEKCFPETSRMLLEKYLGNIAPVFFAHAGVGYGMADIPRFLQDDAFREQLIQKSRLFIRKFWEDDFAAMSPSVRRSEIGSLATRLNRFMHSPIVGNIIGQKATTVDFRKAIENKEIVFVRLPIKTLKDDATLIGTMLVAQIHAAIFSFADMKLEDRPGFSLYVDEFQHFCSSDFAEMFTEGRTFGARVTVAHQFRGQLPDYLASASMTARTKITFQTTQEDAPKLAPLYLGQVGKSELELDPHPVRKLETYAVETNNADVQQFVNMYLRQMRTKRKGERIYTLGTITGPWVEDPEPYLNDLLYQVQKQRDYSLSIPFAIPWGFSPCPDKDFDYIRDMAIGKKKRVYAALRADFKFPSDLLTAKLKSGEMSYFHFLYYLRRVMVALVQHPIGKQTGRASGEVVQQIINLPQRRALVKIGNDVYGIGMFDTPEAVSPSVFEQRRDVVVEQTRRRYCRPATEVEREIEKRLGLSG